VAKGLLNFIGVFVEKKIMKLILKKPEKKKAKTPQDNSRPKFDPWGGSEWGWSRSARPGGKRNWIKDW
jgi:hypothetical protein